MSTNPIASVQLPVRSGDLERAQNEVLDLALKLFGCDIAVLFPINPLNGDFGWPPRVKGDLRVGGFSFEHPRPNGLGRTIIGQQMVRVPNLQKKPEYANAFTVQEGIESLIGLTVYAPKRTNPLAIVYIDYRKLLPAIENEDQTIRQFSGRASAMLHRAWVLERYEQVGDLGREINQQLDDAETLFRLLDSRIRDIIDTGKQFALGVIDPASDSVARYVSTSRGVVLRDDLPLTPAIRTAMLTGSVARLEIRDGADREIFVPMLLRQVPLGYLAIEQDIPFDNEDYRVVEVLRNHVTTALNGIRLFEDLDTISRVAKRLNDQVTSADPLPAFAKDVMLGAHADIVTLYVWSERDRAFQLPPTTAGDLLDPYFGQPTTSAPELPTLLLECEEAIFCEDAATLPGALGRGFVSAFQEREKIASSVAIPLRVSGSPVGLLFVNYRAPQQFGGRQKRLITSLAGFAATALHSATAIFQSDREHEIEMDIVRRVDSELNRSTTLDQVMRTILQLTNGIVQAEEASLMLADSKREMLTLVAAIGPKSVKSRGWTYPLTGTTGIVRWVFEHGRSVRVDDRHVDEPWKDLYIGESETMSELDVPLLDGDNVIGVLNFESPQRGAFTNRQLRFVETMAGQGVLAVKRAQDYDNAAAHARVFNAMQDLSKRVLQLSGNPIEVLQAVVRHALILTPSTRSDLDVYTNNEPVKTYYCDLKNGVVSDVQEKSLNPWPKGVVRGIMAEVAKTHEPYYTKVDADNDGYYQSGIPDIHSELAVPLLTSSRELLGVLNVESRAPFAYNEQTCALLQLFADEAVIAFEIARSKDKAAREVARMATLVEASEELANVATENHARVCELVTQAAAQECACLAAVHVLEARTNHLFLVRSSGDSRVEPFERIPRSGLTGRAIETGKVQRIDDVRNPPPGAPPIVPSDPETRSLLVAPIVMGTHCYGSLGMSHPQPHYFGVAEENFVRGLARLLALTFHRFESLRREITEKRSEILSQTAHDGIRLVHALGPLSLVRSHINDARAAAERQDVEAMNGEFGRITTAVEKVLALSTALGDNMDGLKTFQPGSIALEEIFAGIEFLRDRPDGIDLDRGDVSPNITVYADRNHATSILENVIRNAVEAMPRPGKLTLRAADLGGMIEIDVEDTGPGIDGDPEDIFIFLNTTKSRSGRGIGLWSARTHARVNGGDLVVASVKPTVFRLTLPSADPDWSVRLERNEP